MCEEAANYAPGSDAHDPTAAGAHRSKISLFSKYSPMLAKGFPHSAEGQVAVVEEAMQGRPFVMDIKLDGECV